MRPQAFRPHPSRRGEDAAPQDEGAAGAAPCAPISSTSNFPPPASRCARRARAIPRGCWWCSPTRSCATARLPILPLWLEPGDQLVVNDTKVIVGPAQGPPHRPGHRTEDRGDADQAPRRLALAGAGAARRRSWRRATRSASAMRAGSACSAISMREVEHKGEDGEITLSFSFHGPALDQAIADLGAPPLPPYIASKRAADERDAADYQTMFAANEGAVAAPTAGLHFTPALEAALRERGIGIHRITLHVGAGTFLPVKVDDTAGHKMHAEWGAISRDCADALNAGAGQGRPHRRRRHHLAAAAGKRHRRRRHHRAVRGRDRDLHHAGLSVSRGRYSPDQFSSAALDAVHAGIGLQRARHHASGPMPTPSPAATGSIPMATPACCFVISPDG